MYMRNMVAGDGGATDVEGNRVLDESGERTAAKREGERENAFVLSLSLPPRTQTRN